MHVHLDQRAVSDAAEAVKLSGFDDENFSGAGLELHAVDGLQTAALPDELDLVVRMAMRTGTPSPGAALSRNTEMLTSP